MAKPRKPIEEEAQQEEMTVVVLRFKGSSQTLQKSMDAVGQALGALGPVQVGTPRRAHRALADGNGAGAGAGADIETPPEDEETADAEPEETPRPAARASVPPSQRKYKFLNALSLAGDGTPWKEFAAARNPQTHNAKYLTASLWLQKHGGQDTYTANHVFTLFRAMKWEELADFTQPMRLLKSKQSVYETPTRGQWKLNAHGVEVAEAATGDDASEDDVTE